MKKRTSKTCYVDDKNKRVKKPDAAWKVTATLDARGRLLQEKWLRVRGKARQRLVVFLDDAHNLTPSKKARWMVMSECGSKGEVLEERWAEINR